MNQGLLCGAVSIGRRNTLIFRKRWSVPNEVSSPRIFTDEQKSEIWDRWQRGESMNSIGHGFDRSCHRFIRSLRVMAVSVRRAT